ncbi:N-6 DNA methylase [Paraclostridium bifermentans]|uniref:N-6 DNA methylase n=1 Tax=Paraclostridium bifermentans TaxID=1490 RepID=UPI0024BAEBB3|nr:N-6 DNA methylase [Paraclostridium bifermentans]
MQDIKKIEGDLWEAADQLRANSKLTASEYSMPVLGLIFLRHAYNRFLIAKEKIEENLPSRGGVKRPIRKEDFESQSAIFLPEEARYDYLLNLEEGKDIGNAINDAMISIEKEYDNLQGSLPKNFNIFDNDLLAELLKIFNSQQLRNATGDVFGRIYEYFLNKFAMSGAQEGGEFFTPISLVQLIVNVIEPKKGIVFDPACGSAGMFVQTGHFIEIHGENANEKVTFFGQEKAELNSKLAKMNLAVHGLEGKILEGNTFYEDKHELIGKCDYVMANPPFNVDGVDSEKIKGDPRLPFGIPGINKKTKAVSNGNYLWIQYFHEYLNETGRAGFVMASSASDAGHGEKDVREQLVKTGDVDVMVAIGNNFFYTRSLPCGIWFFDKNKPENRKDKILMLDARNIFRKVNRTINDFSDEQLKNLTAITWLYRGENDRYLKLIDEYINEYASKSMNINAELTEFENKISELLAQLNKFKNDIENNYSESEVHQNFCDEMSSLERDVITYRQDKEKLVSDINNYAKYLNENKIENYSDIKSINELQHNQYKQFEEISLGIKSLVKAIDHVYKETNNFIDKAEKELNAKGSEDWSTKEVRENKKNLEVSKKEAIDFLKDIRYVYSQVNWLQSRFEDGEFKNVEGLCKVVDIDEVEDNDWSLTPGRYVGVAKVVDEDFDFEGRLKEIQIELDGLNEDAFELANIISKNMEDLF